jgi:hypothetical protein
VFVNSLSDLYHDAISDRFIAQVFDTMCRAHWHHFQILTKRSTRLRELSAGLPWPSNIWQGVSVENAAHVHRIDDLRAVPAAVRFLSIEPLLGPIPDLDLRGIDWVIVGGESGPKRRPVAPEWVRQIRDQCLATQVPFFFKQWGGRVAKAGGRELDHPDRQAVERGGRARAAPASETSRCTAVGVESVHGLRSAASAALPRTSDLEQNHEARRNGRARHVEPARGGMVRVRSACTPDRVRRDMAHSARAAQPHQEPVERRRARALAPQP